MKRSNEPVFWGLFGAGGMVAALLTPVLILITGILAPMGAVDFSFARVDAFASNILGGLIIWAAVSFPLWLSLHRLYHCLHDFGVHAGNGVKAAFYGAAALGTVAAAYLLLF
ncbi:MULTISPECIES: fumarate reductase subunit FrdD [Aliagarivorans]|uniref:fumarate reductase subunit FrdD n=1 Tax=Aliagarivorans TaxID=882379 RepID=UPI0003F4D809|nr:MULTISPECIES: fumarate reductase subunit FrdD [Aliagarivorans]